MQSIEPHLLLFKIFNLLLVSYFSVSVTNFDVFLRPTVLGKTKNKKYIKMTGLIGIGVL